MARIRTQAIKLGIFVVTVIAVMMLALVLIGGLRLRRALDTYHIVTDRPVLGLERDSAVTLHGVMVGKVVAIEIDRSDFSRVRVELAIDPGIELPVGSTAYLQRIGVTGQRVIDITGGTLAEGRLPPGSTIPRGQTTLEMLEARAEELSNELSTMVADARQTIAHAKEVVAAVDPARVAAIAEAIDPRRVRSIVAHTERTVKVLESSTEQLERAATEGRAHLSDMAHDVETLADRAATVLEHADDASLELSRLLVRATTILDANEDDVHVMIGNIRRASKDAEELVRALRLRPSLLLRSTPPKERKLP